jgi:hypothetical protein
LKGKRDPEKDARYCTPLQINPLFPTWCVLADGIGSIPLSTRNQG